ncbi:putative membrane protein [Microbacterium ginsengiterrae]|uniref:Putative membrane protein n=1 Tax=Microbacterium ginsengiterrae TaxID=546115 RepID=A0A7W9FBG5_9MICO|nr:putative membrane protein [Microbacterium ginsengiterrae]
MSTPEQPDRFAGQAPPPPVGPPQYGAPPMGVSAAGDHGFGPASSDGTPGASPAGPSSPAPPPAEESLADGEWHRLHPLTPLFKGGLVLIIVAGILANSFRERIIYWAVDLFAPETHIDDFSGGDPVDWVLSNNLILIALASVLGVLIVLIAAFWLVWRFQQFRIDDEHVEVRKGIIFRSQRRAPLDRVQGVNLTRPFPARLVGMAKLEVVGAGTDANVPLEYLTTTKAEGVRADILRLASGARAARLERAGGGSPAAAAAPGVRAQLVGSMNQGVNGLIEGVDLADVAAESVVKIPTGRLVGSQLLTALLWLLFFGVLFGIMLAFTVPAILADGDPDSWLAVLGISLGVGIPMLLATIAITWSQISKSLRYSIAPTPDGVRITYGLFTTVTETIPPGRIFAVEVTQSVLWRPFGWWMVKINRMSGKSLAQQQSSTAQQFNIVLPVGDAADVQRVLGLILPDLPAQDAPLVWEHGIQGPQTQADPYRRMVRRAWWRRPLSWKRHGFAVTDFALLMRRGVMVRKLAVFPLVRLQGISSQQGPIDRLQRVGYLKAHSVTGPVLGDVVGIDSAEVNASLEEIAHRAAVAVQRDHGHRWAEDADAVAAVLADTSAADPAAVDPSATSERSHEA